ncbi:MAG: FAD-binding oxidoreductase [Phycisphaerae bacterium]|nr:FAD-binding oxidoreductase [Phycisphaerae bacterium]
MSVPLWRCSAKPRTIRCEVAVVGGGITGVGAALALKRRGIEALLIERGEIASGASGRNAGYLMRGAADNYVAATRDLGRASARQLWKWTEDNLTMLRKEGIESLPTYRRVPSCLLAMDESERAELHESAALMREDGFALEWVESGRDAVWRSGAALGGLLNPDDAACNPCDLLKFLVSRLDHPPMTHTEVAHVELADDGVSLKTAEALIEAKRCLVCLNAYTSLLFPALSGLIQPKRGQILAARTGSVVFDYSYYANHGYEYFRQATPEAVIIGGWRRRFAEVEVGFEERTTEEVQRGLEGFGERLLGAPLEVTARWSGTMGFTPDGLPLIGPIDAAGRAASAGPLWVCGGYTGHGMSMAFKAAHEAVEAMLTGAAPPFPLSRFLNE